MKKGWVTLIVIAACVFLGFYAASPILAFHDFRDAAEKGDRHRIEQRVDFPAVRESLKSQLNARMMREVQSNPDLADNPFAGLAAAFAPTLVNAAVDALVTPDNLAEIAVRGRADEAAPTTAPQTAPPETSAPADAPAKPEDRTSTHYGMSI